MIAWNLPTLLMLKCNKLKLVCLPNKIINDICAMVMTKVGPRKRPPHRVAARPDSVLVVRRPTPLRHPEPGVEPVGIARLPIPSRRPGVVFLESSSFKSSTGASGAGGVESSSAARTTAAAAELSSTTDSKLVAFSSVARLTIKTLSSARTPPVGSSLSEEDFVFLGHRVPLEHLKQIGETVIVHSFVLTLQHRNDQILQLFHHLLIVRFVRGSLKGKWRG